MSVQLERSQRLLSSSAALEAVDCDSGHGGRRSVCAYEQRHFLTCKRREQLDGQVPRPPRLLSLIAQEQFDARQLPPRGYVELALVSALERARALSWRLVSSDVTRFGGLPALGHLTDYIALGRLTVYMNRLGAQTGGLLHDRYMVR